MGLLSHYSKYPSQLKYQIKKNRFKASVLYKQLLSSVPYATLYKAYHRSSKYNKKLLLLQVYH